MTDSFLQEKLNEYVSLRIALGIPLGERELRLRDFVGYLQEQSSSAEMYAQIAIDWACAHKTSHSITTQHLRLSLARCFLRHVKASLPEIEIPDLRSLARHRRPVPYIFSTAELKSLMRKAGSDKHPSQSIHHFTLQTIIGLMACSGLRAGEIIRLKTTDLHADHDGPPRLLIQSSKFKKSRWVPLHYTAYNRLVDYVEWREQLDSGVAPDAFFVGNNGKPLSYQRLRRRFVELLAQNKLLPKSGPVPTLHSLRHTFAVRRVRQWYAWRMNTRRLLPILSVYLGHKNIESSYWYLSATPELMNAAAGLFEKYANEGGLI
jgi:integrase/recombinase XerD